MLYQDYLEKEKVLSFDEMTELHKEMLSEIADDEEAQEFYRDLVEAATRYASIRAKWSLFSREEKISQDALRTSRHNSVITNFNLLSRYLRQKGREVKWRDRLGYIEDDPYNRKTIGDFACYIVFINSIMAR